MSEIHVGEEIDILAGGGVVPFYRCWAAVLVNGSDVHGGAWWRIVAMKDDDLLLT